MDWADDVAYSVHDLEDGLHAGLVTFDSSATRRTAGRRQLTLAAYCPPGFSHPGRADRGVRRLLELDCWPRDFDGSLRLVGRGQEPDQRADRPVLPGGRAGHPAAGHPPLRRYAADLAVPRQQRLECALLKGVTAHYVMSRSGVGGRAGPRARDHRRAGGGGAGGRAGHARPGVPAGVRAAADDAARLRVVIDQIASLTDTSALAWHQRLRATGT